MKKEKERRKRFSPRFFLGIILKYIERIIKSNNNDPYRDIVVHTYADTECTL